MKYKLRMEFTRLFINKLLTKIPISLGATLNNSWTLRTDVWELLESSAAYLPLMMTLLPREKDGEETITTVEGTKSVLRKGWNSLSMESSERTAS